jgi:putative oxidoreductase
MAIINRQKYALSMIRILAAATMIIHGGARLYAGGVVPFGGFLEMQGFPIPVYLAWGITIFEIAGGVALLTGFCVRVSALIFAAQLLMGIALVHWREGWFVVGLGRNGMEYSVLLIICFIAVAFGATGKEKKT